MKQVKRALYRSIPSGDTLTFPEMLTLVAKICNSINSRPLGVHYGSTGVGEAQPLTVNQLLLGRSSTPTVPVKCLSDETVSQRLQYAEKVTRFGGTFGAQKFYQPCYQLENGFLGKIMLK